MSHTNLKFRTFDELMNAVSGDFHVYNNEGMIDPGDYIKIAQFVNKDLGLKLNKVKETTLEIRNGKAKLPDDFNVMSYAVLCGEYTIKQQVIMGTQTEEVIVSAEAPTNECCSRCNLPEQSCICENTYIDACGNEVQLVVKRKYETRTYKTFAKIKFKPSVYLTQNCINVNERSIHEAQIKNGYVYCSVNTGTLYISYMGAMEDDEGNLLVLDHDLINEYYETAVKEKILQNLYFNGEDVERKWGMMQEQKRKARVLAQGIVNTPDFNEIKTLHEANRKAMYKKYYYMFSATH